MSTINALLEVDKEDARKYLLSIHSLKCAAGGGGLPAPTDERARAATAQQAVEAAKTLSSAAGSSILPKPTDERALEATAQQAVEAAKTLSTAAGSSNLPKPTDERARAATAQQAVEAAKKLRKESVRKADSSTPLMASNFSAEQKKRLSQLMFESGI